MKYLYLNNQKFRDTEIPDAFACFFKSKVDNITRECQINDEVYNGTRLMNTGDENFMSETNVMRCRTSLKIKNCEGVDRIPLRVLNDGARILCRPITALMYIIYETKRIPDQWRQAKIIPTHKNGPKDNVENYRPISNLCTMSKVYEKLILEQMLKLAKHGNFDLTGESQHGFKAERSTITAALAIQSVIARAIDQDDYYVLGSLDLSAAFDVVNRDLLLKRLDIMGFPDNLKAQLKDWLSERICYVD